MNLKLSILPIILILQSSSTATEGFDFFYEKTLNKDSNWEEKKPNESIEESKSFKLKNIVIVAAIPIVIIFIYIVYNKSSNNGSNSPINSNLVIHHKSEINSSKAVYSSVKRSIPSGILEVDFTCYINSYLQALLQTPYIGDYLLSGNYKKDLRNGLRYEDSVVVALANLLKQMNNTNGVVDPTSFIEKIRKLPDGEKTFKGYGDSANFFNEIFSIIDQELVILRTNNHRPRLDNFNVRNKEDLKGIFPQVQKIDLNDKDSEFKRWLFYLTSEYYEQGCNNNASFDLSPRFNLDIRIDSDYRSINLNSLIKKYVSPAIIEEVTGKTTTINSNLFEKNEPFSLPDILTINFLRENQYKNGDKYICTAKVIAPDELDMSEFVISDEYKKDGNAKYSLFATISHNGLYGGGSHYFSTVKRLDTNEWYKCSDSHIQIMGSDYIKNNNDMYTTLFYKRCNAKDK